MDSLPLDVWGYLSEFIDNNTDKCNLMKTCKEISKCTFYFYDMIDCDKIIGSEWFDLFTFVYIKESITRLPLFVNQLHFGKKFRQSITQNNIPPTVYHIILAYYCNIRWDNSLMPPFVKTLTINGNITKIGQTLVISSIQSKNSEWVSRNKIIFSNPVDKFLSK